MPRNIRTELDQLLAKIAQAKIDRHLHQPALDQLIAEAQMADVPLPSGVLALNAKLVEEAVEAQFDNLPV